MKGLFVVFATSALAGVSAFLPPITSGCRSAVTFSRRLPIVMGGNPDEIRSKIHELVLSNSGGDSGVADKLKAEGDKANFIELGMDSLDLAEFSMGIQNTFELEDMSDEEIGKFKTVGDVLSYIQNKKK